MNTTELSVGDGICDMCGARNELGMWASASCYDGADHGEVFRCLPCIQREVFEERTRRARMAKRAEQLEAMRTTSRCPMCDRVHNVRDVPTHLDVHTDKCVYDCCNNDVV